MIWYVATYGNMGLLVEHFRDQGAYEKAVAEAELMWEAGDLDSYVHGEVE
jgi:hypothetical protein